MKRTDIHSPSNIDPNDYYFVAAVTRDFSDIHSCLYIMQQREMIEKHMAMTKGKWSNHEHGGNCHICGAWMIHYAVFYHEKTNVYIMTGFDCAAKMDMGDSKIFKRVKTEYEAARKSKAGRKKARGLLTEHGLLEFWDSLYNDDRRLACYLDDNCPVPKRSLIGTFDDIVQKLIRYGSLSDKQWKFLNTLKTRVENFEADENARAEKMKNVPDAPAGRHEITGKVISIKEKFYYESAVWKMLVEANEGFRIWCTIPSNILDAVEKDNIVKLNVTLEPSDNDPKFAFGSRPAKAIIVK
jgi:hypothetical protein